ncbi:hypothetical protein Vretimale_13676 [Volvox reticuliferus]|uniref:BTB domain-containing protein n=1 Tax=Volvox reticuliferus TaxID=1737510 RepID=A0A8J4GMY9_9CHLO|nr:hypothetical protein Vretifemale_14643 [Volvox reticuliferus]GIM09877.1 hypothetical protein Vretimale_13676 [Volvox reticuliferus]
MDEASCPSLAVRKVSLQVSVYPVALVSRPTPSSNSSTHSSSSGYQTLLFSNDKDVLFGSDSRSCIFELLGEGNEVSGQFRLAAQPLALKERDSDGELKPYMCQVALHRAVYDPYSKAVYFVEGRALMRLDPDNVVSPLAGHREQCGVTDGPGPVARFQLPQTLVSDGAGNLYVGDGGAVRRVALPPRPQQSNKQQPEDSPGDGQQQQLPQQHASVTTVYGGPGSFVDVAYDFINRRLFAATIHAVYHIPDDGRVPVRISGSERPITTFPGPGSAHSSGSGSGSSYGSLGPPAPAAAAAAVAGFGQSYSGGNGGGFECISGLLADSDGGLLIADRNQIFRLEADGGSETVISLGKSDTSWGGVGCYPVILHNGWIALCQNSHRRVLLLQLGLRCGGGFGALPYGRPAWQWHHEGVVGLLGDLASLLAFPDGSDDVEVAVGDRLFCCHRLILATRCMYFRRLFAGGFADSGARQVVLQDADPDAFEHLLRHLYTGDLGFPPQLLRPVAELADRLLLTQVVHHVQRRLLASVHPGGVVADMLWAHRHGFDELLAGLKDWYLRHQGEVLSTASDSVRQLAVAAPSLMYDLHCATVRQVDRRR